MRLHVDQSLPEVDRGSRVSSGMINRSKRKLIAYTTTLFVATIRTDNRGPSSFDRSFRTPINKAGDDFD